MFVSGLVTGMGLLMAVIGVLDHNWSVVALGSLAALVAATTLPRERRA